MLDTPDNLKLYKTRIEGAIELQTRKRLWGKKRKARDKHVAALRVLLQIIEQQIADRA